jgi:glutaredoxin 3
MPSTKGTNNEPMQAPLDTDPITTSQSVPLSMRQVQSSGMGCAQGKAIMNITIYTKSGCPNCDTAKALLKAKGLQYSEVDVEVGDRLAILLNSYPEARQMPQIWINDQRVGGLAGLQAALKKVGL